MKKRTFPEYLKAFNELKRTIYPNAKPLRVAVLRSYTCETIEPMLSVDAFDNGFMCEFFFGGYRQYAQEILNLAGELYNFNPDITILMIGIEDIAPQVFDASKMAEGDDLAAMESFLDAYFALIIKLRSRVSGAIIINNFVRPHFLTNTHFDTMADLGYADLLRMANMRLGQEVKSLESCYILDIDGLASRFGLNNIFDTKSWYHSKNPYTIQFYAEISQCLASLINAIHNIRKKCIVLDLDNTMWRGIIGEDGLEGIEISTSYADFQRQLLFWKQTGIILAICSKNNYEDAAEVFKSHDSMVLTLEDFSAMRINWQDKASNIADIAKELNIGLDSMIYIDDSDFECELVHSRHPEIHVIQLDGNSVNYPDIARKLPLLDFVFLTDEDRARTGMYKAQSKRDALMSEAGSLEDFLASLETIVTIEVMKDSTILRASQLTQKTNQFNLTTRRYTVDDLKQMTLDGFDIYIISTRDKFGDNGISGLLVIHADSVENQWCIDTFLLSCRVMGRDVEKGVWGYVASKAKVAGINKIVGKYIPTPKNKPVEMLLPSLGFTEKNGELVFEVSNGYACPDYISVEEKEEK